MLIIIIIVINIVFIAIKRRRNNTTPAESDFRNSIHIVTPRVHKTGTSCAKRSQEFYPVISPSALLEASMHYLISSPLCMFSYSFCFINGISFPSMSVCLFVYLSISYSCFALLEASMHHLISSPVYVFIYSICFLYGISFLCLSVCRLFLLIPF